MAAFASLDNPFTSYYAQLLHQGNMLQDHVRTGTYQNAFLQNKSDFEGKVVLDVGTGSGILAFFACQAGAAKVYAVEASDSAEIAKELAEKNGFGDRVIVVKGKVEEITIPEKVDIIISEPIGTLLVHERMIESYIAARDRFLKPGGMMFPTTGTIVLAPFTDEALYKEQMGKASFWDNAEFYGIDLTCAKDRAQQEYMSQPIIGYYASKSHLSQGRTLHRVDFTTVTADELKNFEISFDFVMDSTGLMHGIGAWFDLSFDGTTETVILSTAPDLPGTHWYQARLLLYTPIAVNNGQLVSGNLKFEANDKFSYFISMEAELMGSDVQVIATNPRINLHDQMYHYLYGSS
jgi:type I protein arginine methyltransferase